MNCHQCGAEIPAGQNTCPMCYAAVRKPGWLSRLVSGLFRRGTGGSPEGGLTPGRATRHVVQRSEQIEIVDERDGRRRVYHSLDEVPPEIREKIEAARARARPTTTRHTFTMRDASGVERTYDSIDDMPPEVRAIYERMLKERGLDA